MTIQKPTAGRIITDILTVNEDGTTTGWACAINDLGLARVPLQECAAPRGECPRGFYRVFECREKE